MQQLSFCRRSAISNHRNNSNPQLTYQECETVKPAAAPFATDRHTLGELKSHLSRAQGALEREVPKVISSSGKQRARAYKRSLLVDTGGVGKISELQCCYWTDKFRHPQVAEKDAVSGTNEKKAFSHGQHSRQSY
ncbi:unnamed protein product [Calypogeia fissa]